MYGLHPGFLRFSMFQKKLLRLSGLLILGGVVFVVGLPAQDPAPSVAEAARRAREKKEKTTKPAPVVTDDTLHPSTNAPATATPESTTPAESSASEPVTTPDSKEAKAAAADKEKKKKEEIETLKQRITEQKETVRLAAREIALQQDTYYSNPDYAHDKAGKDKLDAMKSDLQQKQDVLADLRGKLSALGGTEDPAPASAPSKP
jgi:hypothetical protein